VVTDKDGKKDNPHFLKSIRIKFNTVYCEIEQGGEASGDASIFSATILICEYPDGTNMHRMKRLMPILTLIIFGAVLTTTRAQDVTSDLLGRVNSLRASLGLPPYTINGALAAAAENQAQWMATTGEVSHVQADGSRPRDRARAAGYDSPWISENIYAGRMSSTETAWDFWINSPIHYASLTNTTYSEIGIASATGATKSYVLVFGAPPDRLPYRPAAQSGSGASGSSDGGGQAAPPPPSFVVGLDSTGNIMHEVQPGDTLGDIALIYGYTWDVIPTMLAINGMSDADIRVLKQGSVILVPPQDGTYTPTAPGETATPTPSATAIPVVTDTPASVALAITETPTPVDLPALPPPSTYVAATVTPIYTAMLVRTVPPAATVESPVMMASYTGVEAPGASPPDNRTLLLAGAVLVQVLILGYASFEFVRRSRK
jgi:uncharacterized protein YkwD